MSWLIWPIGVVVLVAAGFLATYLVHHRSAAQDREIAWSEAHSAMAVAAVSRDAAPAVEHQAEQLFHQAELIVGRQGGVRAARRAAGLADRADRLWRGEHG